MTDSSDYDNTQYDPLGTEAILIHETEADFLWEQWDRLSPEERTTLLDRLWGNIERALAALVALGNELESGE